MKGYRLRVNGRILARYATPGYCMRMAEAHARKGRTVAVEFRAGDLWCKAWEWRTVAS